MKNILTSAVFLFVCFFSLGVGLKAQAPQKFSYQAVVRDGSDELVVSQAVGIRISIRQGSTSGSVVYSETHSVTSNTNGLITLEIGSGTVGSGNFSTINWSNGPFFLQTETDPSGGTNYSINTSSQLLSVPYALYAVNAGNSSPGPQGPQGPAGPQGPQGPQGPAGSGIASGTAVGQMMYWDGDNWVNLNPGTQSQILTLCEGIPTWTNDGICPGNVGGLSCADVTVEGTLLQAIAASEVSFTVGYTGGVGGSYNEQFISSSGVSGLTAYLPAGVFSTGNGNLTFTILGTPATAGNAVFSINIGGQNCNVTLSVAQNIAALYPAGSVFCNGGPADVVEVLNFSTGRTWMDRNLSAGAVGSSGNSLYQWGRFSDGHQCIGSTTTTVISNSDNPGNSSFILSPSGVQDWRSPQNTDLWQGVSGTNNPCPTGFRLPTIFEWEAERITWSTANAQGAANSTLQLPLSMSRSNIDNSYNGSGFGFYWSSTVDGVNSRYIGFGSLSVTTNFSMARATGMAVRCIKQP